MRKQKVEMPDKVVFETFRDMRGDYHVESMTKKEPSCFNGIVSVRKFRITIEVVDEPVEVIQERIRKLKRESTNYHEWGPLRAAGKKYGIDLDEERRPK